MRPLRFPTYVLWQIGVCRGSLHHQKLKFRGHRLFEQEFVARQLKTEVIHSIVLLSEKFPPIIVSNFQGTKLFIWAEIDRGKFTSEEKLGQAYPTLFAYSLPNIGVVKKMLI